MAGVEAMTLTQWFAWTESVQQAVGYVEQPGGQGQEHCREQGHVQMHRAGEEPRPKGGYGGGVQAKQVPPLSEIEQALRQRLV